MSRGRFAGIADSTKKSKEAADELGLTGKATPREFMEILKPYFWPRELSNRIAALLCFTYLGLSKLCNIAAPVFLGRATDKLARRSEVPVFDLVAFAALRLLSSVFDESQRLVYRKVKEVAGNEVSCKTFSHLHSLSYSWHVTKRTGVVLRAMDRGIAGGATVVDMLVLRLVPTIIEAGILVILFAQAYGSPASSGVLAASFVAYFLATYALTQWRSKIRAKANVADNDAATIATDSLTGFEVVKAFSAEGYELKRYAEATARYQAATKQSQTSLVALNVTQAFIMRAALAGVLVSSAANVISGQSTVGDFVALQTWVMQLFQPLSWLGALYTMIVTALVDMGNLAALLKEQPAVQDKPDAHSLHLENKHMGAAVEFRDVAFAYPTTRDRVEAQMQAARAMEASAQAQRGVLGRMTDAVMNAFGRRRGAMRLEEDAGGAGNRPTSPAGDAVAISVGSPASSSAAAAASSSAPRRVVDGVSFRIDPGKTIAIVGPTGSGKSTISRLLFRYYDVAEGSVIVDGQDVRDMTQSSLRAAIGVVPQDAFLFNESIRYNIAYGRPDASEEEIVAAAKDAQIWDFVSTLKGGMATKVGERGLKLSGGERQRIAIARTLLKNPPILVLDEATSALDSLTEAEVQGAIARARQGRTVLVIAHRLSTIRDADEIVVLENGKITERGTHEQLLEKGPGGKYHALWTQQAAMVAGVNGTGGGGTDGAGGTGANNNATAGGAAGGK